MNPSTKEAFDKSECSGLSLHPVAVQSNGQLQKAEVPAPVRQENCFAVFGSHNTRESSTVTKQELVSDKDKYSAEALALQKLLMPFGTNGTVEKTIKSDDTPLKVPDNNPFRIRKPLVQIENTVENVSIVSSVEYIDVCSSPDNFQEEGSENLSRKRKFQTICSDQPQTGDEQVSGVTEVENLDILCLTVESQESVNSKTRKSAELKESSESEKTSKRSKCKKAVGSNRTILNFFTRV